MRRLPSSFSASFPAGAPFALIFGYVAIVAMFRRSGLFDLSYHAIVLVLIGFSLGAGAPFREIATAMLATMLAASVFAYLFGAGARDERANVGRKFAGHFSVLDRRLNPPVPSASE